MPFDLIRKLKHLLRHRRFESELDDEIRFHIDSRVEELVSRGRSPGDALAQARREFGGIARLQEDSRAAWRFTWFEDFLADLRYAARTLRRAPGFTAAAVLSLALGIGANTSIFSLTAEFLFSEPSVRDARSLAEIRFGNSHSELKILRMARDAGVLPITGYREEGEVNFRSGSGTHRLNAFRVTGNFFETTGVPVTLGRGIGTNERNTVVISHHLWQSLFGADPSVIGRPMQLDGEVFTIAGVLPKDHRTLLGFGFAPDVYIPDFNEEHLFAVVGRLPSGVTHASIVEPLRSLTEEIDRVYPQPNPRRLRVTPLIGLERLTSVGIAPVAMFFAVLMVVVGIVLAIACINVAGLLLARASSRRNELAVRLAIGAGRGRIIRQLLTESLLLAFAGCLAGLGLNLLLTSAAARIQLPIPVPIRLNIQPDWRLLLYSGIVAVGSAVVAGLLPALRAVQSSARATMKQSEHQVGGGRWNLRSVLVAGQLALSTVLLAAGLLFIQNMTRAKSISPGFDTGSTLWASVRLVPEQYASADKAAVLVDAALNRIRALPGVESASITNFVPFNNRIDAGAGVLADIDENNQHMEFYFPSIGPDYFRTMGIAVVAGREFQRGASDEYIVNESFARARFGRINPVGHTMRFSDARPGAGMIVGVVANSMFFTLGDVDKPAVYRPMRMRPNQTIVEFLVRASGSPAMLQSAVNDALGSLDPSAGIIIKPMRQALGLAMLPSQAGAVLLGTMGLLGLVLASIGLYGVLAYTVARRTREIGLRVALGADYRAIAAMLGRDVLALAGLGVAVGVAVAVFALRPLAMFLVPGLTPSDPLTFTALVLVLAAVAALAAAGPARQALRIDPMAALHYE